MLFAIHAFDSMYQGLHGIESYAVIEVTNEKEAEDIAIVMSSEIIESYENIYEAFEDEAFYNGLEEGSQEWYDYIEECIGEDIAYDYWKVKDETTKSLEELNDLFCNDPEDFINNYCQEVE